MDSARLSTKSLQDLLSQQLQAAYECLALNQAISARLGDNGQMLGNSGNSGLLSARSHDSSRQPHFMGDSIATHAAFGKWMLRQQMKLPMNEQGSVLDDAPARGNTSSSLSLPLLKLADPVQCPLLSSNDNHQLDGMKPMVSKKTSTSDLAEHAEEDEEETKQETQKEETVNARDEKEANNRRIDYEDEEEEDAEEEEYTSFGQNDAIRRDEAERDLEQQVEAEMRQCSKDRATCSDLAEPLLQCKGQLPPMGFSHSLDSSPTHSPHDLPKRRKGHGRGLAKGAAIKKQAPKPKKKEYNVEDLYKDTGCAQKIARSNRFQSATLLVIILNTFWIAVDTDYNKAEVLCEAAPMFQIVDNLFCVYFTFEVLVRFLSFKNKSDACVDPWFLSDSALVSLMIWETWIQVILYLFSGGKDSEGPGRSTSVLRIFRAFRLLRISRMTRLLRLMPELFILVKSIGAAMRCMFVTLCMLLMVIYIFSIMFTQLLAGDKAGKNRFESVPMSMNFMLTQVLCGFDSEVVMALLKAGPVYYILWLIYVLTGSLSIMNVLIGILCEVVSGTADAEKERAVRSDVEQQILLAGIDQESLCVGKQDMMNTLESEHVAARLEELGVDVHALLDFVHFFEEDIEIALSSFVELVVQFRGAKQTTVRDIVDLRKFISMEISLVERHVERTFLHNSSTHH